MVFLNFINFPKKTSWVIIAIQYKNKQNRRWLTKCIERLVDPLPEDDSGSCLVESHHTSCDHHVAWYLPDYIVE